MQSDLDRQNADFWDELCGSTLARAVGISDHSDESLRRFDEAYFGLYPYLRGYVDREAVAGAKVLEIGLGYGTLGDYIASRGCEYHGLDIAPGPVRMMRHRLERRGIPPPVAAERVREGSALAAPYPDETFDFVYSIGCLHHTGDTAAAVREVRRILKPGGKAVVMLYNRNSFRRRVQLPFANLLQLWKERYRSSDEYVRAAYDKKIDGTPAPHVDFHSRREIRRRLFREFRHVRIDVQNFDSYVWRGRLIDRAIFLRNIARLAGTDLYVVATR